MPLSADKVEELVHAAEQCRGQAYAPYSHFHVGAALLCADGNIVTGCNVENASYGLTICAERNAIAAAIAAGQRDFEAIAIAAQTPGPCPPCGACRQVLVEFNPHMQVILAGTGPERQIHEAAQLLPGFFSMRD